MSYFKPTPRSWTPPHCPNPNCLYHNQQQKHWAYKKAGTFKRFNPPHSIQRFTCKHCNRSFSSQTFSTTYWQKLPWLDRELITKTTGCMANRQIARDLKVSPSTIDRHISRLARHCLLFHLQMIKDLSPPTHVVVDGFETFELSQYYPFHHNLAVEKDTDFLLYFTDSELRRKGRMTAYQKQRRAELENTYGRPDTKAIEKDMAELLRVVLRNQTQATVYSDEHQAYRKSIQQVDCQIKHLVTPGKAHRDSNNSLWSVNLVDLVLRHSSANHKRETLAWSKRRQCSSERLAIFLVWRNYIKGRREKQRGSPTPAMCLGVVDRRLTVDEILGCRIFVNHVELPARWEEYYWGRVSTRALPNERMHELKYAT